MTRPKASSEQAERRNLSKAQICVEKLVHVFRTCVNKLASYTRLFLSRIKRIYGESMLLKPSLSQSLIITKFRHLNHYTTKKHLQLNRILNSKQSSECHETADKRKNIGIVAHINAGKTTTTERILYHAGSTDTVGDVDRGNTVTDYLVQERDRGITITSAAVTFDWKKHRINLIDTPGHVDFTFEVERSLSVLDGAVTIVDSSAGVEAQTITVWNQATKYQLPNVIFLNKFDKPAADYRMCMKDLKVSLGINASLIQIPVKSKDGGFSTIIDIIQRQQYIWNNPDADNGSKYCRQALVETGSDKKILDMVECERELLVNKLTDLDDRLACHVIECDKIRDVSASQIEEALRRTTLACKLSPVLVGSSFKYIGVQQLMDAIVMYLPSPMEREQQIRHSINNPLAKIAKSKDNCSFIFKILHDKRLGSLSYLRVCNGLLKKLQRVQNLETNKVEQVKKVYRAFADELKEIDEPVYKDDIVVVTGLTESRTGDILVDQNFDHQQDESIEETKEKTDDQTPKISSVFRLLNKSIVVPKISRLEPVYFCSIESYNSSQQLKLESALACLAREDPSFSFDINELGITTIRGMGKLHLEIARDRIKSEHGIDSVLGPLLISYRETIDGAATEELSVNKLINGAKSTLFIKLYVRSLSAAGTWTGKRLRLDCTGDSSLGKLRLDHRKAIESGFISAMLHGPSMGFPVIDCDILLLDFKANGRCSLPVISSAASQCLMSAMRRCSPVLLEPIMLLEVVTPSVFNGSLLGDISTRRGLVLSTTAKGDGSVHIRAHTPLSMLADYSEYLRIVTSGRGSFSMELHSYATMSEADRQSIVRL